MADTTGLPPASQVVHHSMLLTQVSMDTPKTVPKNPLATFAALPVELITKIIDITYALEIDELPSTHPLIHNRKYRILREPQYSFRNHHHTCPWLPLMAEGQPALSREDFVFIPPVDMDPRRRKYYLESNPGVWARPFRVMFVSKQFYDIAIPIRYKEVHINAIDIYPRRPDPSKWNLLHHRLSNTEVLQKTKNVHLKISLYQEEQSVLELVKALRSMSNLRNVCISVASVEYNDMYPHRHINGEKLIDFFDLDIETLTFIWHRSINSQLWQGKPISEEEFRSDIYDDHDGPVPSVSEYIAQLDRATWMRQVYAPSSWCSVGMKDIFSADIDTQIARVAGRISSSPQGQNGPILSGKPKIDEDFTVLQSSECPHISGQYQMDRFVFSEANLKISPCPHWNLEQDPHNHPDQLNAEELEASKPVREWRKGFWPWTEAEKAKAAADKASAEEVSASDETSDEIVAASEVVSEE